MVDASAVTVIGSCAGTKAVRVTTVGKAIWKSRMKMRLGDLDALREMLDEQYVMSCDVLDEIDSAPTVCCAECRHSQVVTHGLSHVCEECLCGSNFERREP